MIAAYPLTWPAAFPRAARREPGRFKSSLTASLRNVQDSLRLFDASPRLDQACTTQPFGDVAPLMEPKSPELSLNVRQSELASHELQAFGAVCVASFLIHGRSFSQVEEPPLYAARCRFRLRHDFSIDTRTKP